MKKRFIFLFVTGISITATALPKMSFKDSYLRYLSGHDLIRVLAQKFPSVISDNTGYLFIDDKSRASLGDSNPANGEMTYRTPSASFVGWYVKHVQRGLETDLKVALMPGTGGDLTSYFGKEAAELIKTQPYAKVLTEPKAVAWTTLSQKIQDATISHLIFRFIGPGILKDEEGLKRKLLISLNESKPDSLEALKQIVLALAMQDEFLTY